VFLGPLPCKLQGLQLRKRGKGGHRAMMSSSFFPHGSCGGGGKKRGGKKKTRQKFAMRMCTLLKLEKKRAGFLNSARKGERKWFSRGIVKSYSRTG